MYKTWFKDPPWIGANLFASLECSKTATKIYLVDDIIQFVLMSYFPTKKNNLRLHNKRGRLLLRTIANVHNGQKISHKSCIIILKIISKTKIGNF